MQAGYLSKTRIQLELPPATLSYFGSVQSQIRNPHSTIHNRSSWRPRVFLRPRSGQAHPATYRSGTPRNQSRGAAGRLPGGTAILFALAPLRSVPQAGSQFRGLATGIHEISGLE